MMKLVSMICECMSRWSVGGDTFISLLTLCLLYICTSSDNDEEDDEDDNVGVDIVIVRANGVLHMKRLLRLMGITFDENTFPTQDKFKDSDGGLVPVKFKGLTLRFLPWETHDYLTNDFGTALGGFGINENSNACKKYTENYSKEGKNGRKIIRMVIPDPKNPEATLKAGPWLTVCSASYAELQAVVKNAQYDRAFRSHTLTNVFEGLMFGQGGVGGFKQPLQAFGDNAMLVVDECDTLEDAQKYPSFNAQAVDLAVGMTKPNDWEVVLYVYSAVAEDEGDDDEEEKDGDNDGSTKSEDDVASDDGDNNEEEDKEEDNENDSEDGSDAKQWVPGIYHGKINSLRQLMSKNENYLWNGREETVTVRIDIKNANAQVKINDQLGPFQTKARGRRAGWANESSFREAIRDKTQVAIECPTSDGGSGMFIFTAVKLNDEADSSDEGSDIEEEY